MEVPVNGDLGETMLKISNFTPSFIYFVFRQRGREGEREGKKHPCVFACHAPPSGDLAQKVSTEKKFMFPWKTIHCL